MPQARTANRCRKGRGGHGGSLAERFHQPGRQGWPSRPQSSRPARTPPPTQPGGLHRPLPVRLAPYARWRFPIPPRTPPPAPTRWWWTITPLVASGFADTWPHCGLPRHITARSTSPSACSASIWTPATRAGGDFWLPDGTWPRFARDPEAALFAQSPAGSQRGDDDPKSKVTQPGRSV